MAKQSPKWRPGHGNLSRPSASSSGAVSATSTAAYAAGVVLLAVCVVTSFILGLEHLAGLSLPGCGAGSTCARATESVWGRVPYVDWPVAYLGLAYFVALLVAWVAGRRGVPLLLRLIVRCGALLSLGFLTIMIAGGYVCTYCLATHLGHLGFWIVVERTTRAPTGSRAAFATLAAVFLICSAGLGAVEWHQRVVAARQAEEELASTTEAIIATTTQRADAAQRAASSELEAASRATVATGPTVMPDAAAGLQESPEAASRAEEPLEHHAATRPVAASQSEAPRRFTGRYRLGPEKAPIRVVKIADYQCRVCRRIDADIERIFEQRDDMSVSFKHFPMGTGCNRRATRNAHPNACWAARAAEAAGILRGNDGFWEMHRWLFKRGGSFTRSELHEGLRELGYDVAEFERVVKSEETLQRVKADVEEAISLGVYQTPTIFINGVELKGWQAPKAIERAVEQLAATHPPPLTPAHDHPLLALGKLMADWRAEPERRIPAMTGVRALGPEGAPVRVVMFGDFQQDRTAETDLVIRRELAERGDMRYEYHYFPFNKDCNPVVKRETKYPQACRAAYAAEAAGRLAGADGYWAMHAWLLENRERFSDAALHEAATRAGIDPAALLEEMNKPEVRAAVVDDANLGKRLSATRLPTVFVNGQRVPRWTHEGENILPRIFAEVASD